MPRNAGQTRGTISAPTVGVISLLDIGLAVVVFAMFARSSFDPVRTFTMVAIPVAVMSRRPDLALYLSQAVPGATRPAVLALISLHVVAIASMLAVLYLGTRRLLAVRSASPLAA